MTRRAGTSGGYPFETLPDYLAPDLELLFVGINPGIYSVRQGRYFARRTSRFWPAFSRSRLSEEVRAGLGRDVLTPEDDATLLEYGIGFTDVVKAPSANASQVTPALFAEWAPRLLATIEEVRPLVVAFHGVTAYRAFARYALGVQRPQVTLGPQARRIGHSALFVVPNPSPANAHVRLDDLIGWYNRLADFLEAEECEAAAD